MAVRFGAGGSDLVAGVVALTLATGVTVAADTVRADAEATNDCSVSSTRAEATAFELAALCDRDIEIESLRTVYDTFWATPRATIRAEAATNALRTDVTGEWRPVDPTVRLAEDGTPQVTAPVFDLDLAQRAATDEEFVSITDEESGALSMGLSVPLGEPYVDPADPARVVYPIQDEVGSTIAGADLLVRIHPDATGFTPVVRVMDADAAARVLAVAGDEGLAFDVEVGNGLQLTDEPPAEDATAPAQSEMPTTASDFETASVRSQASVPDEQPSEVADHGGFWAVDGAGDKVFTGTPGVQWDSAGGAPTESAQATQASAALLSSEGSAVPDDEGAAEVGALADPPVDRVVEPLPGDTVVSNPVEVADHGRSATVVADSELLLKGAATGGVYFDPGISGNRNSWTAIKKAWPSSSSAYKFSGSGGLGYCDVSQDLVCERSNNVWRLVWKFTGLSFVGDLEPSNVLRGSFRAYGTHQAACTVTRRSIYQLPSIQDWTNWNNYAGNFTAANKHTYADRTWRDGCSSGGPGWVEWNATQMGKSLAQGGWPGLNIGLMGSESGFYAWSKVRYDARLSFEYNRLPGPPSGLQTIVDGRNLGCVNGADRPYSRWLRPQFSAIARDPDGQSVAVKWRVRNVSSGATVWESNWSSAQPSGSRFTTRVPEGKELANNVPFRWEVISRDSAGWERAWSLAVGCQFTVDTTKPAEPVITPIADHPNAQAVYETDQERGGVGLKGCFEIYAPSGDATAVEWAQTSRTAVTRVQLGSTRRFTVCVAPTGTGPKYIYAKAIDASGLWSDAIYEFDVAAAREDGVWTFDDPENPGEDTSVRETNELAKAGDLSVSGTGWATGPHTLFGARDGDVALDVQGTGKAATVTPVIDTRASFVVSAHVRLDADAAPTGWYTALSQDSTSFNGFRLGYRPVACPTVDDRCWAFGVQTSLTENQVTYVMSDQPVRLGQWVHLLGEYDKAAGKVRLFVCDAGTPDDPAVGEPKLAEASLAGNLPVSAGAFVVGRGLINGSPANRWNGQIDNVRIFRGEVLAEAKIRRLCQGAEASAYAGGNGVDDVDPTTDDDASEAMQ